MNSFWNELPKPFFILAPMEAVTDVVFRHVVEAAGGPDVYFTEFTNAASYCSSKGKQSTQGRLAFTPDEQPMVAQIWGNKPEQFEQMAIGLKNQGFSGIDINMGCPEKSVVKNEAGSGLIRTPDVAIELIASAKKSGLPVSVKTRLGDIKPEEWHDWLSSILEQDIVNLTIHLRTRSEMSKVPAHYELINDIKALRDEIAPHTLLTINGDIKNREHGELLVKEYGVDGIMIGRGIFQDPYAFEKKPSEHTREDYMNLLKLQIDLHDQYSKELGERKFDPLKRFFKIYIRDFPGASELRDKLMHTKNTSDVRTILETIV